ncbi:hypothetical protein OF83DRAFT_34792 [Amylostereum chailletii]|nr:hypothetical protein OF83DRAFT_34792 [Amylostereum chailletii]
MLTCPPGIAIALFIRWLHTQGCAGTYPTDNCKVDVMTLVSLVVAINNIAACSFLWFTFPDTPNPRQLEDEERALHEARVREVNAIMIELTQPPRIARAHHARPAPQDLAPPPSYEEKNKYEGFDEIDLAGPSAGRARP